MAAEDLGKPAVAICNQGFAPDASSAAAIKGMPGLRVVPEAVPSECSVMAQIEAGISAAIDDIITALTKPLTEEEKSPKREAEKPSKIIFKGNLEEVNRFFYRRGWGDGLPIIPPTEEAVAEMLTGTDLPPDHIVEKIIPRLGKATVEKIAINAVMAGALPTYMPLLIAGVQGVMDPRASFGTTEVSTASWIPFWIINGPIRHDLHINSGAGAMSPGDIANATIGRAMGLIIKNIGGARKGIEDMGIYGNSGKYSMVTGENEEESPWEPLHVDQGFKKEDSTITVSFPFAYSFIMGYGSDAKGILQRIIYNIRRGQTTVIMNTQHARALAEEGWTKKDIAEFVSEYARVPAHSHPMYALMYEQASSERQGGRRVPANPNYSVRIIPNPDLIRIIVAGGPGGTGIGLTGGGEGWVINWVTKKIELPANWDKLVAKYKDIVPTYAKY
jgi:hypothetical protein